MCPHTCICVLILLQVLADEGLQQWIDKNRKWYFYICVLIFIYMCRCLRMRGSSIGSTRIESGLSPTRRSRCESRNRALIESFIERESLNRALNGALIEQESKVALALAAFMVQMAKEKGFQHLDRALIEP